MPLSPGLAREPWRSPGGALAETIATPEERPAVSLSHAEVEADQLDRTKIGINEKNFTTGELAPVGICS